MLSLFFLPMAALGITLLVTNAARIQARLNRKAPPDVVDHAILYLGAVLTLLSLYAVFQ